MIDTGTLGSTEFAVKVLGVKLVMVDVVAAVYDLETGGVSVLSPVT